MTPLDVQEQFEELLKKWGIKSPLHAAIAEFKSSTL
jgi:hypothetical protein